MSTDQETAQCYHLSIKGQRCIREEGHQELHLSGAGTEWAIITKNTPELAAMSEEQPRSDGQGIPVAERLIALIRERTRLGVEKYGEPLTTHNGRDAMLDSLHESVDQNQYPMQVVLEQADEIAQLSDQIGRLADYLLSIGGPDRDESACETAVRLLKDMQVAPEPDNTIRSLCGYLCPNHEKTAVVYCNRLQHYDVDSPHICENGHVWSSPVNADPSA